MNRQMVRFVVGRIMCIVAVLMIPSVIVALVYNEGWAGVWPFLFSMSVSFIPGVLMSIKKTHATSISCAKALSSWLRHGSC